MGSFGGEGAPGGAPPADLPEGVKKEIIQAAPSANWKKPKTGDLICVHYVGTLLEDGSEFDSSRSRGKAFEFTLGKGQVIKGWDLGVATMKKGEIAKFTLSPEYAYGEAGSPPSIPANATLVFEVEVLSWTSKDDLFSDEGVIKSQIKEGSGWKKPKEGEEVSVSLKVLTADKSVVIEERNCVEHVLGSNTFGPLGKAVDKALIGMRKDEEATLTCAKEYAYGEDQPDGVVVELKMHEVFEISDVSFANDKSLMKKQVKEGEGYEKPKDGSSLKLEVLATTNGSEPLPGFTAQTLEFSAGNGEVCDALEMAVVTMKSGEQAILTCTNLSLLSDERLGLKEVTGERVLLTLKLIEFEKGKDHYSMNEEEKVGFGTSRKEMGSTLFKQGRTALALERYKKVAEMFSYIDSMKDETMKTKAKDLKKICELNKAACFLKLKEYGEAKKACDTVLKEEPNNVKAMFRKAQACYEMKDIQDCIRDLKRLIEIDVQNKEARVLMKKAQVAQKEDDKKSKGLFTNMCKALGKGPIPDPYKEKKPCNDNDMSDNDEPFSTAGPADGAGEILPADGAGEILPAENDRDDNANDSSPADESEGKSKVGGDKKGG